MMSTPTMYSSASAPPAYGLGDLPGHLPLDDVFDHRCDALQTGSCVTWLGGGDGGAGRQGPVLVFDHPSAPPPHPKGFET